MDDEETLANFQNFRLRGSQNLHAGNGERLCTQCLQAYKSHAHRILGLPKVWVKS